MKETEEIITKKVITLSAKDVYELLPDEKFKWEMYWDYRDELSESTLKECMPDIEKFKMESGYNYQDFVSEWKMNIEDKIIDWNWDDAINMINEELRDLVDKKLKEKGISYDRLDFDFYIDEIYEFNWCIDELLERSRINRNLCWFNNFDGFSEDESAGDEGALDQFLKLYPNACGNLEKTKSELERACSTCYSGSDLKLNFKSSMLDFLNMLETGKCNAVGTAVLHLYVNGSCSEDFEIDCGEVELDKQVGESIYDRWSWQLDGHYGVIDVCGGALNTY